MKKIRSNTRFLLQRLLLNVFKEFSDGRMVKFILKKCTFFFFEKSKIYGGPTCAAEMSIKASIKTNFDTSSKTVTQ